jgi:hypothetical protein
MLAKRPHRAQLGIFLKNSRLGSLICPRRRVMVQGGELAPRSPWSCAGGLRDSLDSPSPQQAHVPYGGPPIRLQLCRQLSSPPRPVDALYVKSVRPWPMRSWGTMARLAPVLPCSATLMQLSLDVTSSRPLVHPSRAGSRGKRGEGRGEREEEEGRDGWDSGGEGERPRAPGAALAVSPRPRSWWVVGGGG